MEEREKPGLGMNGEEYRWSLIVMSIVTGLTAIFLAITSHLPAVVAVTHASPAEDVRPNFVPNSNCVSVYFLCLISIYSSSSLLDELPRLHLPITYRHRIYIVQTTSRVHERKGCLSK